MSFKHSNCNIETTLPSSRGHVSGVTIRSARRSAAPACQSSALLYSRGAPIEASSGGMAGGSAGSARERRTAAAAGGECTQRKASAPGNWGLGGGTNSQAFMKAYYEEKQKNQNFQSPAGGLGRRSARARPGVIGTAVGSVKMNRIVNQADRFAQRTQRVPPQKANVSATGARKSATNHGAPPASSSGIKTMHAYTANSAYHSQKSQPPGAVRSNVKCSASDFGTIVSQHKRVKSNSSNSHINGSIARKTQQKLIASTLNTLCGEQPAGTMPEDLQSRPKQCTSKSRRPDPPEIIRPPKLSQSLTPKGGPGKPKCLQQLYWGQEDDVRWVTPAEAAEAGLDGEQPETAVQARSAGVTQMREDEESRDKSAFDGAEAVERLQARVAELEQQLEEERQDNIEKDIQIQQLLEIVKLKDLQIKEFQIEKVMASTMRKQEARTSQLDMDRQRHSNLSKQVGQTTGSCTRDQESRDGDAGTALRASRSNRDAAESRTLPAKDVGCSQSALTTTLNLDDGALSAENAMVELNACKRIEDGADLDDIGLQKELVARKEGRCAESRLQDCLTQHNSDKSLRINISDARERVFGGEGSQPIRQPQADDVGELAGGATEEPPQPTARIVRPAEFEDTKDAGGQPCPLLGGSAKPDEYIQANFFDPHSETIDHSLRCEAVEMDPGPQVFDRRGLLGQRRLLQTLDPPATGSALRQDSPHQSLPSSWHPVDPCQITTAKYRLPEEEQDMSKSSTYISKSFQINEYQSSSFLQYPSLPAEVRIPPYQQAQQEVSSAEDRTVNPPQQIQHRHRSFGALPPGQSSQHGERSAGCPSSKEPQSARGKNVFVTKKNTVCQENKKTRNPPQTSNHKQYQTQSSMLAGGRSGRKHLALPSKQQNQRVKSSRTTVSGVQGRPGRYLNHLQKQYGTKASMLTTSSAAASSMSKSLDKVAVSVPNIPARSPGTRKSNGGAESPGRPSEDRVHSYREDGRVDSAEKALSALEQQHLPANIDKMQELQLLARPPVGLSVSPKPSSFPMDTTQRSPISTDLSARDPAAHVARERRMQPSIKTKSSLKLPFGRDSLLNEPLGSQRDVPASGLHPAESEAPRIGTSRAGLKRRKGLEYHGALDAKNQTQKISARRLGLEGPHISQRGGASARQLSQSQSNCQIPTQGSATHRKAAQPASGQKVKIEGQGLTQRLLNSQTLSTCRRRQSSKPPNQAHSQNSQVHAHTKTAITEPIVERQPSASQHGDSLSEQSKQRFRHKKASKINKNEVLFQQVLRNGHVRDASGPRHPDSATPSGELIPTGEPSRDEGCSRSNRSRTPQSRISMQKSSQNSQNDRQVVAERERSHYLDGALPPGEVGSRGKLTQTMAEEILLDGADNEGWNIQGNQSCTLNGPAASASAAPSDSASQCNYRTREDVAANGHLSSQASGIISCGGGQAATKAPAITPTPTSMSNQHNSTAMGQQQRRESNGSVSALPYEGQTFDYVGARPEDSTGRRRPTYDFNLLSPFDLQQEQDPELPLDSHRGSSDQNAQAQQSLQQAIQMQLAHREHRPPACPCVESQMFQVSEQTIHTYAIQDTNHHQPLDFAAPGMSVIPTALYALQNSTDFDVIYEKNSIEEMENSVLSKSRMSKVSRISGLGPESQPACLDSQRSVALEEQQLAINAGVQESARRQKGKKAGKRHEPALSGTLHLGDLRKAMISYDQLDRPQQTERGGAHLRSAPDYENEGALGTNRGSGGGVDGINETKDSLRRDLCDYSLSQEGPYSLQGPSKGRTKKVWELRDAIKKDQEDFLMHEILAPNTERTPRRLRRPRSQRRGQATGQSAQRLSRGKREYCTQAHDAPPVHPFEGPDSTGPTLRMIPTARGPTGASKSKLSAGVLGSRAPEKRRGTEESYATSDHFNTIEAQKATKESEERIQANQSPNQYGESQQSPPGDLGGDKDHDTGLDDCDVRLQRRNQAVSNVQAAQDCMEVLDQSLRNFLAEDNPEERPRAPEMLLGQPESVEDRRRSEAGEEEPLQAYQMQDIHTKETHGVILESLDGMRGQGALRHQNYALQDGGEMNDRIQQIEEAAEFGMEEASTPSCPRGQQEQQSNFRFGRPEAQNQLTEIREGLYAYNGAFETFSQVGRAGLRLAVDVQHNMVQSAHTARSTEGRFGKGERSPTGSVFSPRPHPGAAANQQHPGLMATPPSAGERVLGKEGPQPQPASQAASQCSHNVSVLTLQNLPPASKAAALCSPAGRSEEFTRNAMVPHLLKRMPGIFYQTLSELLGEKLPLIIFTNRKSFQVSLDAMIACYSNCQAQIIEHKELVHRELSAKQSIDQQSPAIIWQRGDAADRYMIVTIPEEDGDHQPSNSQHDSAATEAEARSFRSPRKHQLASQSQQSAEVPELNDEHLEAELLEITQVQQVYEGIIENIKRFRRIVA